MCVCVLGGGGRGVTAWGAWIEGECNEKPKQPATGQILRGSALTVIVADNQSVFFIVKGGPPMKGLGTT